MSVDGGPRQDVRVVADRDLSKNVRLGVSYRFADFCGSPNRFDHDHRG